MERQNNISLGEYSAPMAELLELVPEQPVFQASNAESMMVEDIMELLEYL